MKNELDFLRKHKKLMQIDFGIKKFDNILKLNSSISNLTSIETISSIIKSIPDHKILDYKPIDVESRLTVWSDVFKGFELKNQFPFTEVNESLFKISNINPALSDSLTNLTTSQIFVSNSMLEMTKVIDIPHLKIFNSLNVTFSSITNSFLHDIKVSKEWEQLDVVKEANNIIASHTLDLISDSEVSQEELTEYSENIIEQLSELLLQVNNKKAKKFLTRLIAIISFLMSFYGFYQLISDNSNQEVINETKREIQESEKRITNQNQKESDTMRKMIKESEMRINQKMDSVSKSLKEQMAQLIKNEADKLNKIRIAKVNINLKRRPKNKSQNIGFIEKGQSVTVIEIHGKYFLIVYFDNKTGDPKSGFVLKKHFKIIE